MNFGTDAIRWRRRPTYEKIILRPQDQDQQAYSRKQGETERLFGGQGICRPSGSLGCSMRKAGA